MRHLRLQFLRAGVAAVAAALAASSVAVQAQDTGVFRVTSSSAFPGSVFEDGLIDEVRYEGIEANEVLAAEIRSRFAVRPGEPVDWLGLQSALRSVRQLDGVADASFVLERNANPTRIILTLKVSAVAKETGGAGPKLPDLILNDRSRVTVILNGGFGFYSDSRPWFGDSATFTQKSPVATAPPGRNRATWGEMSVEAGLGAVTQVGSSPVYVYGAATTMLTAAVGQDLFTDDTRALARLEKAYAGILIADKPNNARVNASFGMQNYNLDDGFLISQFSGSANAGPRPGLFLNPRIAFDMTGLLDVRVGNVRLRAFFLDPNELEKFESRTQFAGMNLSFRPASNIKLGGTYILIPRSKSSFALPTGGRIDREGTETLSFDARVDSPFSLKGLWIMGEYARQWNGDDMRAWAGYGIVGWRLSEAGMKPALSYRYSAFSGDDPATPRYERYDPLLSGGLSEWVQGIVFKKVVGNTNMNVHRARVTASPASNLNVSLDFHHFRARELNNLGGNPALSTLASRDIGEEYTLRGDWFLGQNLNFLFVLSRAVPGKAIKAASVLPARSWTTFEASAFWRF